MMLRVENLSYGYGKTPLLREVSLALDKGGLLTILGGNGAGKSTLLNCIAGVITPHSVRDYIVLGRAAHLGMFTKPSAADYALADAAMERLNIGKLADKTYMYASGGEKQLANIAKILVQQPQIILFDEPTSALDYGNVFKTLRLVCELSAQGFAIIMTTHNPDHPLLLAERLPESRVAILDRSGHLQSGSVAAMITGEKLQALYQTDLQLVDVPALQRKVCAIRHL